jgi:TPR repeat protein
MNWFRNLFNKTSKGATDSGAGAATVPPETADQIYASAMSDMQKMMSGSLDISAGDVIGRITKAAEMGYQPAVRELQRLSSNISRLQHPNYWEQITLQAKAGDPEACMRLHSGYSQGDLYGNRLQKSEEMARHWLIKAADLGHSTAQNLLGMHLLCEGKRSEGFAYIKKSVLNGNQDAYNFLKRLHPEVAEEIAWKEIDEKKQW